MSSILENITPNKIVNYKINSLKSTPKFSPLLPLKENINSKLKIINTMKNNLFSNSKLYFNSNINKVSNTKNSEYFLAPVSKSFLSKSIFNPKTNYSTQKKIPILNEKNLSSSKKSITAEFSLNNSFSEIKPQNTFLNKKRKLLTSEEIELEKMKKEKEGIKKLMKKNSKFYLKSFNYSPMKITPSPLTTFIPFKLSSNNNSKYIKQGKGNTLYEVNKQNQKIRLKMQQKIEKLTDNKTKDRILLNNVDYLKKQNELYNDLFNNENFNNNIIKNKVEQKSLNIKERSKTPVKVFNFLTNNQSLNFSTQMKKINQKNAIFQYINSFKKNKTIN